MPLVLIAVGGNALLGPGGSLKGADEQRHNAREIAAAIAALVGEGMRAVVTHGNGTQVGAMLLRSEHSAGRVYNQTLDVCVAATQGEIGYSLEAALRDELSRSASGYPVATLLTQVVVSPADPAFDHPTKPIGPYYSRRAAEEKAAELGWRIAGDGIRGFRRVVPSPVPVMIVEEAAIRILMESGVLVVALGGGGIPVVWNQGELRGVEAVVDKDAASALLASRLGADTLAFVTQTDCVYLDYGTDRAQPLGAVTAAEMTTHLGAGQFQAGSMEPKVKAALAFLSAGGSRAIITSAANLVAAMHDGAGTCITAAPELEEIVP